MCIYIYIYIYIYPCFRLLSNLSTIQKRDDHIIPAVRSPAGWWWRGRRPTEMPRRNSSDICPPSVVPRSLRPASWLASTLVQQPTRRIEEHKEVHRSGMFTYSFIINGIEGKKRWTELWMVLRYNSNWFGGASLYTQQSFENWKLDIHGISPLISNIFQYLTLTIYLQYLSYINNL